MQAHVRKQWCLGCQCWVAVWQLSKAQTNRRCLLGDTACTKGVWFGGMFCWVCSVRVDLMVQVMGPHGSGDGVRAGAAAG